MDSRPYRSYRPFRPRCLLLGMVLAWIVAAYLPALLIGALDRAAPGSILAAMWAMTDNVALAAKLAYALLFAALLLGSRRVRLGQTARATADGVLGALAMLLLLAFLPESWSRGFGIGLTGARFDSLATPCYLLGGALAGLTFTLADAKCGELNAGPSSPRT